MNNIRFKLSLLEEDRFDLSLAVIHKIHRESDTHFAFMTVVVRMDGESEDNPRLVELAKDIEIALNKGTYHE